MDKGDLAHLFVKFAQDIGRMESDEGFTDDGGHLVNATGMGPVRVVNRSKGQSLSLEVEPVNIPSADRKDRIVFTWHSKAVNIIWVASKLWMKLGGNAEACFSEFTVAGALGSEM